jgi:hypothetical protein
LAQAEGTQAAPTMTKKGFPRVIGRCSPQIYQQFRTKFRGKSGKKSGHNPADNPANNPDGNPGDNLEFVIYGAVAFLPYNRWVLPASLLTRAVAEFPDDFHEGSS